MDKKPTKRFAAQFPVTGIYEPALAPIAAPAGPGIAQIWRFAGRPGYEAMAHWAAVGINPTVYAWTTGIPPPTWNLGANPLTIAGQLVAYTAPAAETAADLVADILTAAAAAGRPDISANVLGSGAVRFSSLQPFTVSGAAAIAILGAALVVSGGGFGPVPGLAVRVFSAPANTVKGTATALSNEEQGSIGNPATLSQTAGPILGVPLNFPMPWALVRNVYLPKNQMILVVLYWDPALAPNATLWGYLFGTAWPVGALTPAQLVAQQLKEASF
jgi:hypothetical protein